MRKILLSLLAFTALSGAAHAADLAAAKAPPPAAPASTFNWTGVYGGLQLGGTFGQTNIYLTGTTFNTNVYNGGVFGGAYAGYNYQIQNYVLGVEGEFNAISNKQSSSSRFGANLYTAEVYSNWLGSVGARAGFAWKNILIYATGGYAFLNNGTTVSVNGVGVFNNTQSLNGFDVGGGLEYALSPNWSWRLEYRYYGFDRVTNNLLNSARLVSESPTLNTVRVGATYRWFPVEPTAVAQAKY